MNKRLAFLQQMVDSGKADSFARYALAMEYRKGAQTEEALREFVALRSTDPEYLPMYLMAGQMLLECGNAEEARRWLEQGLRLSDVQGNAQAKGELAQALTEC